MPHRAAGLFFLKKRRFVNDAGTSGHINICTNITSGLRNEPERKSCPARMPKAGKTAATSCKTMKISANGRVFSCFFQYGPPTGRKNGKNPLQEATLHKKQKKNRKKTRLHQPQTVNLQPIQTVGKRRDTGQTRPHLTAPPEKNRQKTGNTYTRKSART